MSVTSIESLPTAGLADIKTLALQEVWSLMTFPHVLSLASVTEAKLTYPQHCCAFSHPEKQDRSAWLAFQRRVALECASTVHTTVTTPTVTKVTTPTSLSDAVQLFDIVMPTVVPKWLKQSLTDRRSRRRAGASSWANQSGANNPQGVWHTSTLNPNETYTRVIHCGLGIVERMKQAQCSPLPDAFNPCEDVMGLTWLRVVVWAVIITALLGNLMVLIVSLGSSYRLTVSKFLMCNLAFADLTLSMYLLLLAAIDLHTQGVYFNFSIPWQYEGGCQVAGFLAVFSTCYSVFTLTVITMERWYAIRHAIHLTKRLRLRQAAAILLSGWVFALLMATLPLVGVSSYSKTSICLPMETTRAVDKVYVFALLIINAAAFVAICACYFDMYRQVHVDNGVIGSNDANIAKRMALLVFTDFTCLFPIAFFGLTAAFGHPLITVTESKILLVFFFPLNSCANPFLYALFTKQFHKDLFGMMSRCGVCERRIMKYRTANSHPVSMSHSRSTVHNLVTQPTQLRNLPQGGAVVAAAPDAVEDTPIDGGDGRGDAPCVDGHVKGPSRDSHASRLAQSVTSAVDHCVCCPDDAEDDNGYDSVVSPMPVKTGRSVSTCGDMPLPYDTTSERKDSKVTTVTNLSPSCSTEALHQVAVAGSNQVSDDSTDDNEVVVKNGKTVSWTRSERRRSGETEGERERGKDGVGQEDGAGECLLSTANTDTAVSQKHCDFADRIEHGDFNETNETSTVEC